MLVTAVLAMFLMIVPQNLSIRFQIAGSYLIWESGIAI